MIINLYLKFIIHLWTIFRFQKVRFEKLDWFFCNLFFSFFTFSPIPPHALNPPAVVFDQGPSFLKVSSKSVSLAQPLMLILGCPLPVSLWKIIESESKLIRIRENK